MFQQYEEHIDKSDQTIYKPRMIVVTNGAGLEAMASEGSPA